MVNILVVTIFILWSLFIMGISLLIKKYRLGNQYKNSRVSVIPDNYQPETKTGIISRYSIDKLYLPEICSICLDEYLIGDTLVTLNCCHSYHNRCLKSWINHVQTKSKITEWYRFMKCPYCLEKIKV